MGHLKLSLQRKTNRKNILKRWKRVSKFTIAPNRACISLESPTYRCFFCALTSRQNSERNPNALVLESIYISSIWERQYSWPIGYDQFTDFTEKKYSVGRRWIKSKTLGLVQHKLSHEFQHWGSNLHFSTIIRLSLAKYSRQESMSISQCICASHKSKTND